MNNQLINMPFMSQNQPQRNRNAFYNNGWNSQLVNQPMLNTNIERIQGGEASVNAIQLPPNSVYVFFDADDESPYFYIKSVDASGRPSLKTCVYKDYQEYKTQLGQGDNEQQINYVTQEQFDEAISKLSQQMNDNLKKLNDFKSKILNNNKRDGNK